MKQIHIIVAHPRSDSLIVQAARYIHKNTASEMHYLDELNYNPLMPEPELLRKASFDDTTLEFQKNMLHTKTLVLCYPDWWGFPPARLVGWIQRVFSTGIAFSYTEKEAEIFEIAPKLLHLRIIFVVSSGEKEKSTVQESIQVLGNKLVCHAGIQSFESCILSNIRKTSHIQRQRWMDNACLRVNTTPKNEKI